MEKRIKEERKIMVSKGGVPKGRIIPVYLTDEGDVYPIYLHEMGELEILIEAFNIQAHSFILD